MKVLLCSLCEAPTKRHKSKRGSWIYTICETCARMEENESMLRKMLGVRKKYIISIRQHVDIVKERVDNRLKLGLPVV